jgi:hypothetical protein
MLSFRYQQLRRQHNDESLSQVVPPSRAPSSALVAQSCQSSALSSHFTVRIESLWQSFSKSQTMLIVFSFTVRILSFDLKEKIL